jgi:deoxyribodipyrimidine photo-lyase
MSNKTVENGLFIFHRDFRITDNIGLIEAGKLCKNLYTCFIFTPEQVGKGNDYRSQNAIQFMIESLEDLESQLHIKNGNLLTFYGKQSDIIRQLVKELGIQGVFFNKDYTPYAIERDNDAHELCNKLSIKCQMFSDYYLYEPGTINTGTGVKSSAYKKYTPFYLKVAHMNPLPPSMAKVNNLKTTT